MDPLPNIHYKCSVESKSNVIINFLLSKIKIMKSFLPKSKSALLSWQMLVFIILVVAGLCGGSGLEVNGGDGVAAPREFDYFKLALQWPGTVCQRTRHCCSSNACCRRSNAPTEFTIHGLWADYNDGTWPACCTQSSFDIKEISTLLDPLEKYWPSLSCGSPSKCFGGKGSFWGHEWEKHGTCSSSVTGDEYNYFLTALNVYFKYNVTRVLNEAGYVPSNSEKYPLGGIVSAIENAFHATPSLACSNGAVKELYLCFYKDFKPRDCAVQLSLQSEILLQSSCPKYVSLPAHVPLGLEDDGTTVVSW